eukprot:9014693-Prorocentrum_lima.AAC.1
MAGSCATASIASCTTNAMMCIRSWARSSVCWRAEAKGSRRNSNCCWRAAVADGSSGTNVS